MHIDRDLLAALSSDQKKWLARAITGIIVVDGIVDKSEMEYLKEAIGFLENEEEINDLVSQVKERICPPLGYLEINHRLAARLLMNLAQITIVDGKFSQQEAEYLKEIGAKMKVGGKFVQQVLTWIHTVLEVHKLEKDLLKKADNPLF
ncbi:MAG: TerB family tellurite resistance protein [SAR324 cluster bacterium]|nr:TerB family tellurite resistance protein [SAR324 cluster bacterium]